jgi:N-acetylmuramoyl-L-alanine amidase
VEQDSTHAAGGQLRDTLVRGLVHQNLVQLGKADPLGPDNRGNAEAIAAGRHRVRPATVSAPPVRRRARSRLRVPLLSLLLGYFCVFGTSAFRQEPVDVPAQPPAPPESWSRELLDDLEEVATSPSGLAMPLAQMLQLRVRRIVVDPGHGGKDPGARAPGGLSEKDVTLAIAKLLAPQLEQRLGAEVILTREHDEFVALEERAERANRLEADLFLSIHLNWFPSAKIQRVETYYVGLSQDEESLEVAARENAGGEVRVADFDHVLRRMAQTLKVQESGRFADFVQESLYSGVRKTNSKLRNQGVGRAPFVVLMGTRMPSILAEVSFLSDPEEVKRLGNPAHLESIAHALGDGIARYLSADETFAAAGAAPRGSAAR